MYAKVSSCYKKIILKRMKVKNDLFMKGLIDFLAKMIYSVVLKGQIVLLFLLACLQGKYIII